MSDAAFILLAVACVFNSIGVYVALSRTKRSA
jgi:hypothetical protein